MSHSNRRPYRGTWKDRRGRFGTIGSSFISKVEIIPKKGTPSSNIEGSKLVVWRVLYQYVCCSLRLGMVLCLYDISPSLANIFLRMGVISTKSNVK